MHPRTVGRPPGRTPVCPVAFRTSALRQWPTHRAFTLIELLVVIAIIAILVGLLFPAFKAVQNQARQAQAKNDLTQIVNAVNAFYTDYGKYPLVHCTTRPTDRAEIQLTMTSILTSCADAQLQQDRMSSQRTLNTRQIVFISPPDVKNPATRGLGSEQATAINGSILTIRGEHRTVMQSTATTIINQPIPIRHNTGAGPSPLQHRSDRVVAG